MRDGRLCSRAPHCLRAVQPTGKGRHNHPFPKAVCLRPSPPLPLTHVSWVPKKKTWYLLAVDFTAVSGISSICKQERSKLSGRSGLQVWGQGLLTSKTHQCVTERDQEVTNQTASTLPSNGQTQCALRLCYHPGSTTVSSCLDLNHSSYVLSVSILPHYHPASPLQPAWPFKVLDPSEHFLPLQDTFQ